MPKIIIVTEKPNSKAELLTHAELFDIDKNSFSQFFARLLIGRESDCRMFFNENNFLWMHAQGSLCHGSRDLDGRRAILEEIRTGNYHLVVGFGLIAAKIFLSNRQANLANISKIMQHGPVPLNEFSAVCVSDLQSIGTLVALLPHGSGRAQTHWMNYADAFSCCLQSVQEKVISIIRAV